MQHKQAAAQSIRCWLISPAPLNGQVLAHLLQKMWNITLQVLLLPQLRSWCPTGRTLTAVKHPGKVQSGLMRLDPGLQLQLMNLRVSSYSTVLIICQPKIAIRALSCMPVT